jgi:hypothetical protein
MNEIKSILESFSKGKSLRPDGWSVDFYLDFFDIIGLLHIKIPYFDIVS